MFDKLAVSPSYDPLTRKLNEWLARIVGTISAVRLLGGDSASREQLTRVITSATEPIIVFFGHGHQTALLTRIGLGPRHDGDHARLCGEEICEQCLRPVILAYCCLAAREMGEAVRAAGGRFLGYLGELPFVHLDREDYATAFRRPIEKVAGAVLSGRRSLGGDCIDDLLTAYEAEHTMLSALSAPEAMAVCMCLEEHARLLDRRV